MSVVDEPQIAGPQKRSLVVGRHRPERTGGRLIAAVIAQADRRRLHPNLADRVARQFPQGVGIDDDDFFATERFAASDQFTRIVRVGVDRFDDLLVERLTIERPQNRTRRPRPGGDQQRRLGHPVARQHAVGIKTNLLKFLGKRLDRRRSNRLGPVERDVPRRQIQFRHLGIGHFVDAQLVREIWPARDRHAVLRDPLQPPRGPLQKRHRAAQHVDASDVQRHHHAADQTHVVIGRQPRTPDRLRRRIEPLQDQLTVGDQRRMRQHHPLGRPGAAGGVLQHTERIAGDFWSSPTIDVPPRQIIGGQQLHADQIVVFAVADQLVDHGPGRQCPPRVGVDDDAADPGRFAVSPRRERRHRDRPGGETSE